jgi:lysozyme
MRLSTKGAAFLRINEGCKLKAYYDSAGVLTIGCGFTWRSSAFRAWWELNKGVPFTIASTMTQAEVDDALQLLVEREYGAAVNSFLGATVVPQHVYDAMVDTVFNCGAGALKWKWAGWIKAGDYGGAAELLKTTATTVKDPRTGKRRELKGLVNRRKRAALLMRSGVYSGGVDRAPAKPAETPAGEAADALEQPEPTITPAKPSNGSGGLPAPPQPPATPSPVPMPAMPAKRGLWEILKSWF